MDAIVRILSENAKTEIVTVDNALAKLETAVLNSRGNAKQQAIACMELYDAMKSCDKTKGLKFPQFIDARFKGEIKGTSAYAFAQTALLFSDNSDVWDFFSLSAMSELKALYEKDKKATKGYSYKKGISFTDFVYWAGKEIDTLTEKDYQEWFSKNLNALQQIEALKAAGVYSEGAINITPEPPKSYAMQYAENNSKVASADDIGADMRKALLKDNETEYLENIYESGFNFLVNLSTKELRHTVEMYLESKGQAKKEIKTSKKNNTAEPTTAEPTTAEPTTAEPTTAKPTTAEPTTAEPTTEPEIVPQPPTPEELKETALSALLAYLETVEGKKPATLTKAVKYLEGGDKQ